MKLTGGIKNALRFNLWVTILPVTSCTRTEGWIISFTSNKLKQYRWILVGFFVKSQYLTRRSSSVWSSMRRSPFGTFTSSPIIWTGPLSSCCRHSPNHLLFQKTNLSFIVSQNNKDKVIIIRMAGEQNSSRSMEVGLSISIPFFIFLISSHGPKPKTDGRNLCRRLGTKGNLLATTAGSPFSFNCNVKG